MIYGVDSEFSFEKISEFDRHYDVIYRKIEETFPGF